MKLLLALGNFEEKYKFTRHNAGFMCGDYLAYKWNIEFKRENKFFADIAQANFNNEKILIVKPLTYMNLSGKALITIMNFYKIEVKDIFVIYDDISLELGTIRFRKNGSAGGHNGIKSIISVLGGNSDFNRLKIGIGPQPPNIPSEAFVLSKFDDNELKHLKEVIKLSFSAIEDFLTTNIDEAQNKYNGVKI